MRRRDFVKIIAGTAALRPIAVGAQQPERVRRIGVRADVICRPEHRACRTHVQPNDRSAAQVLYAFHSGRCIDRWR